MFEELTERQIQYLLELSGISEEELELFITDLVNDNFVTDRRLAYTLSHSEIYNMVKYLIAEGYEVGI